MLIGARTTMLSKDGEVEYIEGIGEQWLDIGLYATNLTKFQIKVLTPKTAGGVVFGFANGDDNTDYRLFNYGTGGLYFDFSSERISKDGAFSTNTIYEFEVGNNYVKNVGSTQNIISGSTVGSYRSELTLKFLYCDSNPNGKSAGICTGRLYYLKVYENNALVADIVPYVKNGIPCAYDKVRDVFLYNKGSGSFVYCKKDGTVVDPN